MLKVAIVTHDPRFYSDAVRRLTGPGLNEDCKFYHVWRPDGLRGMGYDMFIYLYPSTWPDNLRDLVPTIQSRIRYPHQTIFQCEDVPDNFDIAANCKAPTGQQIIVRNPDGGWLKGLLELMSKTEK